MFVVFRSIIRSIGNAITSDPELRKFLYRYPRVFMFLRRRITPDEKFGLGLTLGVFITSVLALLFLGVLQDLVGQDTLVLSDLRMLNLVQLFRTPGFSNFMLFVTYLARWQVVGAAALAVGVIFILKKRYHSLVILALSSGGGEILVWFLKNLFDRPRPPLANALAPETSFSFPSGHTFVAFSFWGLCAYFLFRSSRTAFAKILVVIGGILLILGIGFSRIYLGAHWPSDVLASYALGAAWIAALITSLEIRERFGYHEHGIPHAHPYTIAVVGAILAFYWAGFTTMVFLTHPLRALPPVAPTSIAVSADDPLSMFASVPRTSEDIAGRPMEPVDIVLVGSKESVLGAMSDAGWTLSDGIHQKTIWKFILASIRNEPYPAAPGSPSFWNARPNELSYAQATEANSVRERHHLHLWETPFVTDGEPVWFGTAHLDVAMKTIFGIIPTHAIDPAIDVERDKIRDDLLRMGRVRSLREFQIMKPALGSNFTGDQFFTDGKAYVLVLQ